MDTIFYKKINKYNLKIKNINQNGGEIKRIGVYIGRFQPLHIGHQEIFLWYSFFIYSCIVLYIIVIIHK